MELSVLPGRAGPASVNLGAGVRVDIPLQSFKALRDSGLVRQTYDYSCGAAALATLLTYGLDDAVTEREILLLVLASLVQGDQALRKKQGLSLLDLQRVAQAHGQNAQGFRLAPAYLPQLKHPWTIVSISPIRPWATSAWR
jgi:uncharacterized protein